MAKRMFSLLIAVCLLIGMMPLRASAAQALTQVDVADTVTDMGYTVHDLYGNAKTFDYTVPTDGATVLIFFSAQCGNCKALFSGLKRSAWLDNPLINIVAVESNNCNEQDLRSFIAENAPETEQYIDFRYAESADLMFRYHREVTGSSGRVTWPVVFVATDDDPGKRIRYTGMAVTQPEPVYDSLCQASEHIETAFTKEVLLQKWDAITRYEERYEQQPSISAPYAAGKLTPEFLANGLDTLNLVRTMVGLPEVTMTDSRNETAQHAAVLTAANGGLDHHPEKPADMDDAFYDRGLRGTSSCNLAYGAADLKDAVIMWMDDGGSYENLTTVGHRDWLLDRDLQTVGFGYAGSYAAVNVTYQRADFRDYDHIAWPSGNFPKEMIWDYTPWSVSFNTEVYAPVELEDLQITLTRVSDGKSVVIDGSTGGLVSVYSNLPYIERALANMIVFHAGTSNFTDYDGVYTVDIIGLTHRGGGPAEVHYTVDFFGAHEHAYDPVVTEPTCTEGGYTTYTCTCGERYVADETTALGHDWDDGTVLREPTAAQDGLLVYRCNRCWLGREESIPYVPDTPELPEDSVLRICGTNRCETAYAVANMLKAELGVEKFRNIIIANGDDFADALAGSYLANALSAPILLHRNSYIDENVEFVRRNLASEGTVYILGGTTAVPDAMMDALGDIRMSFSIRRLAGSNRFVTNVQILEEAGFTGGEILVCNGHNFADALSASATGKPIMLVNNNTGKLSIAQEVMLDAAADVRFTIIGGMTAVSEELAEKLAVYGPVARVRGSNRESTSVEVAKQYFSAPEKVVLAYSRNFPDGLCGGPLAYAMGAPLLLTNARVEAVASEYVRANGIAGGCILGGTTAVSDDSARIIFDLGPHDAIITPILTE